MESARHNVVTELNSPTSVADPLHADRMTSLRMGEREIKFWRRIVVTIEVVWVH